MTDYFDNPDHWYFSADDVDDLIPSTTLAYFDDTPTDIHTWFGLTYSNYLVLNRTILQSMPTGWQHRFVRCLRELDTIVEAAGIEHAPRFLVRARDADGKFVQDPIPHYGRGRELLDLSPRPVHPTDVYGRPVEAW